MGAATASEWQRQLIRLEGTVQGVGFRPFVYRLALELGVTGCIRNTKQGVELEVEAASEVLERFQARLLHETPPAAHIHVLTTRQVPACHDTCFRIVSSEAEGRITAAVPPDLATCEDCLRELFDPADRRYRYPFINCTQCGPRYALIERLPYDRSRTTMRVFRMCPDCQREYDAPSDRRFHAQPNACPVCGPHLTLWDRQGEFLASRDDALLKTAAAIRAGAVAAVKGLGGFHLIVDAQSDEAVRLLRMRKRRPHKPLALMCPSLTAVEAFCHVAPAEARLLRSAAAPIVLLDLKNPGAIAAEIAPGLSWVGIMLPYTPLHHLLLRELAAPIVATSGNRADEPICTDEHEALQRLAGIADVFLIHDRPIARPVDDSVTRVIMAEESVIRRARGYAPAPFVLAAPMPAGVALGGHLKNTVAVSTGNQAIVSQHIGDLDTRESCDAFENTVRSLQDLYEAAPAWVACDKHPDYASTRYARAIPAPVAPVQHHYAHAMAVAVEHDVAPPFLAAVWDGTGYGDDGTIWGGEFLAVTEHGYERVAHLRPFQLPGGDQAVIEPRRCAVSLLHHLYGDALWQRVELPSVGSFTDRERALMAAMLRTGAHCAETTSAGRLFDAVASLLDMRHRVSYEGQAAMELECAAMQGTPIPGYAAPVVQTPHGTLVDWRPLITAITADLAAGIVRCDIAAGFHEALADAIIHVACAQQAPRLVLGGGCFQNALLLRLTVGKARAAGLDVHWPQRAPANDGGLALGQLAATARMLERATEGFPCV